MFALCNVLLVFAICSIDGVRLATAEFSHSVPPTSLKSMALMGRQGVAAQQSDSTPAPESTIASPAESGGEWSEPVNLSRSGASTSPHIMVDSNGQFHALWRDAFDGFRHAAGDGTTWSDAVVIEAPFSTRRYLLDSESAVPTPRFSPYLLADAQGRIHAFWIDDSSDSALLYHSQVPVGQFRNIDAWSSPQLLNNGVVAPVASADRQGRVHLAYVRNDESAGQPAGIYYQALDSNGQWTSPRAIYTSRYLRSVPAEDANVQIDATVDGQLVLAWDDFGREQVFVASSTDQGQSWSAPFEVDRRSADDGREAIGPNQIKIGAVPGSAVVTWSAGHDIGSACTQYYRKFDSIQGSWSLPQAIDQLPGCPNSLQFVATGTTLFMLATTGAEVDRQQDVTDVTTYLLGWNGTRWGTPEVQSSLRTFTNPDTNQPLVLGCQQGVIRADQLHLIACDRGTGRDIWTTTRALGEANSWFPPPPIWQGPELVAESSTPPVDLQLVSDVAGNSHAFWHDGVSSEIYHMVWDGVTWSNPMPIVTLGQGSVEQMTVATFANRLYLLAHNRQGFYFSDADILQPTQWSVPVRLDSVPESAVSPFLLVDNSGLFLTYAVPLNEDRAVFLMRSSDQGRTWSQPRMVFDGASAGWDMVDGPQLAKAEGGRLHMTWLRRSLPPDALPLAVTYSQSDDGGFTWSAPSDVIGTGVSWNRLFAVDDRIVHRLWVEPVEGSNLIWHSLSIDGGRSWGDSTQVVVVDGADLPSATVDSAGRVHVLALSNGRLLNSVWDGVTWQSAENLRAGLADGGQLVASADVAGRLGSLYAGQLLGAPLDIAGQSLFSMWRPLDLPSEALPTPIAIIGTPVPVGTAEPQPTVELTPTTIAFPTADTDGLLAQVPGGTSQVGRLAIGLIPAALVLVLLMGVGLRAAGKRRK